MQHAAIQSMAAELNSYRQESSEKEFWLASSLFRFLRLHDYARFEEIIGSAADICNRKGHGPDRHFQALPPIEFQDEGLNLILDDYRLSGYGAFLIAKHLDETIPAVPFMLNYFPSADRAWLRLAVRRDEWERLKLRYALRQVEKDFAHALRNLHLGEEGYGLLKSTGDKILFGGNSTRQMRTKLGLDPDAVLSDFLPAVSLQARILADTYTIRHLEENPRRTEDEVAELHRQGNREARSQLLKEWIKPEFLPACENIHTLEKRFGDELETLIARGLPLA